MKNSEKKSKDVKLFLISLITAIVLRIFVIQTEDPETKRSFTKIPVAYVNEDVILKESAMTVISPEQPEVRVELKGTTSSLNNIKTSQIFATLDLEEFGTEGEHRIKVDVQLGGDARNVEVVSVYPSHYSVDIEPKINKRIPIVVNTIGNIAEGYVLGDIDLSNEFVMVTGPKSKVNTVDEAAVVLDLANSNKNMSFRGDIVLYDKNDLMITDLEMSLGSVDGNVSVFKTKNVPIKAVYTGSLLDNQKIENEVLSPNTATIKGNEELLESINEIRTLPIDYERLIGVDSYEVKLSLPEGVSLLNPETKYMLTYKLSSNISKIVSFDIADVDIRNENAEMVYELQGIEGTIDIQLFGDKELLEGIDKNAIELYIDVEDLDVGNYEINLKLGNLTDINVREIKPEIVRLNIVAKE